MIHICKYKDLKVCRLDRTIAKYICRINAEVLSTFSYNGVINLLKNDTETRLGGRNKKKILSYKEQNIMFVNCYVRVLPHV